MPETPLGTTKNVLQDAQILKKGLLKLLEGLLDSHIIPPSRTIGTIKKAGSLKEVWKHLEIPENPSKNPTEFCNPSTTQGSMWIVHCGFIE